MYSVVPFNCKPSCMSATPELELPLSQQALQGPLYRKACNWFWSVDAYMWHKEEQLQCIDGKPGFFVTVNLANHNFVLKLEQPIL